MDFEESIYPFVPVVPKIMPDPIVDKNVTKGQIRVEPIMLGSIIGKEVCRCEVCNTKISRQDRFCRECGRRITAWEQIVEVKNDD